MECHAIVRSVVAGVVTQPMGSRLELGMVIRFGKPEVKAACLVDMGLPMRGC